MFQTTNQMRYHRTHKRLCGLFESDQKTNENRRLSASLTAIESNGGMNYELNQNVMRFEGIHDLLSDVQGFAGDNLE